MEEHDLEPMSEEQLEQVGYLLNRIRLFDGTSNMDPGDYTPPTPQELDDTICALHGEILRQRAERAELLAHLRPETLLDLSLAEDVTCDCAEDSREHALDCPRGLLYYLTTLAEKLEKEAAR